MRGRKLQALASTQAFHSETVTGSWPIANARMSTRWAGAASGSRDPSPIMKPPPGMATIHGQVGQSWNRFASPLPLPWGAGGKAICALLAAVITRGTVGGGAVAAMGSGGNIATAAGLSTGLAGNGSASGVGATTTTGARADSGPDAVWAFGALAAACPTSISTEPW